MARVSITAPRDKEIRRPESPRTWSLAGDRRVLPGSEPADALGLLLLDLDVLDSRATGAVLTPPHYRLDRIRVTLENSFNRTRRVGYEPSRRRYEIQLSA